MMKFEYADFRVSVGEQGRLSPFSARAAARAPRTKAPDNWVWLLLVPSEVTPPFFQM
jgi:hypothetical protein